MCAAKQSGCRADPRKGTNIINEKNAREQTQLPAAALDLTK
jgi:hypothetical protein